MENILIAEELLNADNEIEQDLSDVNKRAGIYFLNKLHNRVPPAPGPKKQRTRLEKPRTQLVKAGIHLEKWDLLRKLVSPNWKIGIPPGKVGSFWKSGTHTEM